jgi:hypothetical protein
LNPSSSWSIIEWQILLLSRIVQPWHPLFKDLNGSGIIRILLYFVSNYLDNKKFESLIKLHCSGNYESQDELMGCFDILISNIIDAFHFKVDKEDAKQDCFLLILKTLRNFNPANGSAFNYFTTVIVNNLKLVATKIKRHRLKLEAYYEHKHGVRLNHPDTSSC